MLPPANNLVYWKNACYKFINEIDVGLFCFFKWQVHLTAVNPYFVVADVFWPLFRAEIFPPTTVL